MKCDLPSEDDGVQNSLTAIIPSSTNDISFNRYMLTLWYLWKARFQRKEWTPWPAPTQLISFYQSSTTSHGTLTINNAYTSTAPDQSANTCKTGHTAIKTTTWSISVLQVQMMNRFTNKVGCMYFCAECHCFSETKEESY